MSLARSQDTIVTNKNQPFVHASNKQLKNEIKKKILLTVALKTIKYLGIN